MERLTGRFEHPVFPGAVTVRGRRLGEAYFENVADYQDYADALDKLAAYEDAEEQGRLIVLPCKIGTPCFRIYSCSCQDFYREHRCKTREKAKLVNVRGINYKYYSCKKIGNSTFALKDIANFGKTVFLSREEAEKFLELMK